MREMIDELYPDILLMDGFDDALIGVGERINLGPVAIYSVEKILDVLIRDSDNEMSYEEAVEYYEFNILGAWVGEMTPIYVTTNLL